MEKLAAAVIIVAAALVSSVGMRRDRARWHKLRWLAYPTVLLAAAGGVLIVVSLLVHRHA